MPNPNIWWKLLASPAELQRPGVRRFHGARSFMPKGHHSGKRGRKPLPPQERATRRAAATRRASARWWKKHAAKMKRKKHRCWPKSISKSAAIREGLSVVSKSTARMPRFTWIDPQGGVHAEFWETAEQLIARLAKETPC
ncbi:MAG: hypothetical protein LAN61_10485 [Acidobacteriia bacterium]|nr:hypothetical protein [Terriglobia bacterium]